MTGLVINASQEGDQYVIRVTGTVLNAAAYRLREELLTAVRISGVVRLVIDLAECNYIEADGLNALRLAARMWKSTDLQRADKITLRGANASTAGLIRATRMDALFMAENCAPFVSWMEAGATRTSIAVSAA